MIENIGVYKSPEKAFCTLKIGQDNLKFTQVGRAYYTFLNNRAILAAKSDKDFLVNSLPVVMAVIKTLARSSQDKVLKMAYTKNKFQEAIDFVEENLKPTEVSVLKVRPSEIQDNKPPECSAGDLQKGLFEYKEALTKFAETINNVKQSSDIILRTSLTKKMWGSKDVSSVLDNIKTASSKMIDLDIIEADIEKSDYFINGMMGLMSGKYATTIIQKKEVASKIVDKFSNIKSFMSHLAQSLQGLNNIDAVFQKYTGYPATWFVCGSTYMDFLYDYDNLIEHLVKCASIESKVIEPLLVLKIMGA